jgi:hypothetical protein
MKMEAAAFSKVFVLIYHAAERHLAKDCVLGSCCLDHLTPYIRIYVCYICYRMCCSGIKNVVKNVGILSAWVGIR